MHIDSLDKLRAIYNPAHGRATLKQLPALETHSRRFIAKSPFMVLATSNQAGRLDASPRGGEPGFVQVLDDNTLLIPDAKGNNRLDSLENIIENNHVGCLFFIPGIDETLRINGRAQVRSDSTLLQYFDGQGRLPASVLQITIEEVFLHCAKALMRSKLWQAEAQIARQSLPTMGQMINDQINDSSEPESQDSMIQRYMQDL